MLRSKKAIWLILLMLVFIMPVLFPYETEAAELNWGTVKRNDFKVFQGLSLTVSSPGTAQVFFRTEQLIIIPHGAPNAVFTTQDLQAKGFYSTGSGTETISFSAEEIAQKSGVTVQQKRQVADTTGFNLGAVLGIYNGSNRIAEITSADQVDVVCGPNNPACGYTLDEHLARQDEEKRLAGSAYQDEGLIFCTALGKKLDTRRLYELHCRALKNTGLEHMAFHDLRHTFATLMLERGEDIKTIQELLGHADVSTSANTYTHVLKKLKAASADKMDCVMADAMKIGATKSGDIRFEEVKTDIPRLKLVVNNGMKKAPERATANSTVKNKLSK